MEIVGTLSEEEQKRLQDLNRQFDTITAGLSFDGGNIFANQGISEPSKKEPDDGLSNLEKEQITQYLLTAKKEIVSIDDTNYDSIRAKIGSYGSRILPFLIQKLTNVEGVGFGGRLQLGDYLKALAEKKDFDLLIGLLEKENIEDGFTILAADIADALNRIVFEARFRDGSDPDLEVFAKRLETLLTGRFTTERSKNELLKILALTGTGSARKYLESKNEINGSIPNILDNPLNVEQVLVLDLAEGETRDLLPGFISQSNQANAIAEAEQEKEEKQSIPTEKQTLTDSEKESIDQSLDVLKIPSIRSRQSLTESFGSIERFGAKALPYILEKYETDQSVPIEKLISGLAGVEELDLVLDVLAKQRTKDFRRDSTILEYLPNTILRLVYAIRDNDPQDPRLSGIGKKLLDLYKQGFANALSGRLILIDAALTGDVRVKQFLEDSGLFSGFSRFAFETVRNLGANYTRKFDSTDLRERILTIEEYDALLVEAERTKPEAQPEAEEEETESRLSNIKKLSETAKRFLEDENAQTIFTPKDASSKPRIKKFLASSYREGDTVFDFISGLTITDDEKVLFGVWLDRSSKKLGKFSFRSGSSTPFEIGQEDILISYPNYYKLWVSGVGLDYQPPFVSDEVSDLRLNEVLGYFDQSSVALGLNRVILENNLARGAQNLSRVRDVSSASASQINPFTLPLTPTVISTPTPNTPTPENPGAFPNTPTVEPTPTPTLNPPEPIGVGFFTQSPQDILVGENKTPSVITLREIDENGREGNRVSKEFKDALKSELVRPLEEGESVQRRAQFIRDTLIIPAIGNNIQNQVLFNSYLAITRINTERNQFFGKDFNKARGILELL